LFASEILLIVLTVSYENKALNVNTLFRILAVVIHVWIVELALLTIMLFLTLILALVLTAIQESIARLHHQQAVSILIHQTANIMQQTTYAHRFILSMVSLFPSKIFKHLNFFCYFCVGNPHITFYKHSYCPISCNTCTPSPSCTDTYSSCSSWVASNYCNLYPVYALCKKSCNLCWILKKIVWTVYIKIIYINILLLDY
jgi:hypothetical protein